MPMKPNDADMMIAEEYLRKSYATMNNLNHTGRAKDVLLHIFEDYKTRRAATRKKTKE